MKLIICDKNKELINKLKKEEITPFKNRFEIEFICGDVFKAKKKYQEAKICTASNPSFSAGGGLDKELKEKYPNEWNNLKEFVYTDNLFPLISVDLDIKSNEELINRSLVGVFGYLHKFDLILTGIGTSIGGLNINIFIKLIKKIFRYADLSSANLRCADLRCANLSSADLSSADLSSADLRCANLSSANLSSAYLGSADLRCANLSSADLFYANLRCANLRYANLSSANLRCADLRSANLSSAYLCYANLSSANLSKVHLEDNTNKLISKFKFNSKGMIVYKAIGNTIYKLNEKWVIKKNKYLTEVVNFNKTDECGCGVNFGTFEYCRENYPYSTIWECLIEFKDLVDVCVPYTSDGKARCGRLKLIKIVKDNKK